MAQPFFQGRTQGVPLNKPICLLEAAFLNEGRARQKCYNLEDFVEWLYYDIFGQDSFIQSAHLFRETDPIHHEYALFCVERSSSSNWIRVERAARFKNHRHRIQADMFDPLFKGVSLREQLWLGASKEDIISSNGREILSLSLREGSPGGIALQALMTQISESSAISDVYLLFTENCRWFARRNILSLAERLQRLQISIHLSWKGKEIDPKELVSRLGKDPNGGWQLEGTKGYYLQAVSLVDAARVAVSEDRPNEAIPLSREALSILEQLDDSKRYVRLIIIRSQAHRQLGIALKETGELREALHHMRAACDLSSITLIYHDQLYIYNLDSLIGILWMVGDTEEALAKRRQSVNLARSRHDDKGDQWATEALGDFLEGWALEICRLPVDAPTRNLNHAIDCAREAITHRTHLHSLFPNRYGADSVSKAFATLAHVLDDSGQCNQALEAQSKAVDMLKIIGDDGKDDCKVRLAEHLHDLALYAGKLQDWPAAGAAGYEAACIWRDLGSRRKDVLVLKQPRALICLSHYLEEDGKSADALVFLEEGLHLFRLAYEEDPEGGEKRLRLAGALMQYAHLLEELGRPYDALRASQETVDLYKLAFRLDPTATRPDMARHMYNHAAYAASVEQWDEACSASMHAARLYQQLTNIDRDQYLEHYADALNNWGYNLKDAGRPNEALVPWQEAIECFRALVASEAVEFQDKLEDLLSEVSSITEAEGYSGA